ncbi:sugar ABC transporter ATP-binding protein [Aestuariivirga sp.]|uniref:sugar ABC transporter ATP-binding protein n=1 Tax=Aestuariivirga sp. TaxID=2650926 RepID=UPI0039E5D6CA
MTETAPLLAMDRISKSFGGMPALIEASLVVQPAEVMGLIGQNGAGKSTMIKILNGAYQKDSGTITFAGAPWNARSPQQAQRHGISTIFQEINLIHLRSVAENIYLGREIKKAGGFLDWHKMNQGAATLLKRFDVEIDVSAPLGNYSTAIQQMVAIARALSFDARLVIMDEPTSSLDEAEVEILLRTIRQLKADGVAVIYVSHKLDELYEICDRVTVMRDGRTVAVAAMKDMTKLQLVAAMLGRDLAEVRASGATAFTDEHGKIGNTLLEAAHLAEGRRVRDVSLSVKTGEIVGLAGLLGSGRTEAARLIFAADRKTGGTVKMAGAKEHFHTPPDAIEAGIGLCTEDRKLQGIIPEMSVGDNLTMALMPALARSGIVNEQRQREVVLRFIKELGIKCSGPDQRIRELSGGNQQKVLLARWICMNPRLLILDEPTRGIDVGAKAEIQSLIRRLANQGLGVLMISSELEEIIEGADRVFVLRDGRSVAELPKDRISEANVMHAMAHGGETAPHA